MRPSTFPTIIALFPVLLLAGCATAPPVDLPALTRQVIATETAFADSMARRDFAAFQGFLSEHAIFYTGPAPLRGKQAVADYWKRYFEGPTAPFSWAPESAQVLGDGTLATTTGPVYDEAGRLIARFYSVWRQEEPGTWRIVFDKGEAVCQCAAAKP